jgi:hypothetical protein
MHETIVLQVVFGNLSLLRIGNLFPCQIHFVLITDLKNYYEKGRKTNGMIHTKQLWSTCFIKK